MTDAGLKIEAIKKKWGKKLLILGHHYQRISVLCHADELGDSLQLARKAAEYKEAEKIVFCGVRFMAESADILTGSEQIVYMPEPLAGCPMANMAKVESMRNALDELKEEKDDWLPVVYVNSTADIKACCGSWGGSTCTSSNAAKVFEWVFAQGKRVFFLPDEHLGVNTARDMGITDNEIVVYDRSQEKGGLTKDDIFRAKVIVWKGFCLVHTAFNVEHVYEIRKHFPEAKIIVHPETPEDVVKLTDVHGSTSRIIKYIESAPEGSTIVVGTELNLVDRMAREYKGRVIVKALSSSVCANMAKTNEDNLLDLLENWSITCEVHVDKEVAFDAGKALNRMLDL